jgi:hypothetical protein
MAAQSDEQLRQKTIKLVPEISEQKRQEAYEQGRRDAKAEVRSEALEAAKREAVASQRLKR